MVDQNLPRPAPELDEDDDYLDQQFLEPGAEGGLGDDEVDLLDEVAGFHDTLSAEEAAMRIVDEPPGMNYDASPGYLDNNE